MREFHTKELLPVYPQNVTKISPNVYLRGKKNHKGLRRPPEIALNGPIFFENIVESLVENIVDFEPRHSRPDILDLLSIPRFSPP